MAQPLADAGVYKELVPDDADDAHAHDSAAVSSAASADPASGRRITCTLPCWRPVNGDSTKQVAGCSLIGVLGVLLAAWNITLTSYVVAAQMSVMPLAVQPEQQACTTGLAGAIFFDSEARVFKGCDGQAWSQLAFCCAPERPEPPYLTPESGCELTLAWRPPEPHGSPVSTYELRRYDRRPMSSAARAAGSGESAPGASSAASGIVYRGARPSSCIAGAAGDGPLWYTVTALAIGGESPPSEPVELQPAPSPIGLEADLVGDGMCAMSGGDALLVTFDRPTNRAGITGANQSAVPAAEVSRMLQFSTPVVGPLKGRWRQPHVLELRAPASATPLVEDPLMLGLRVTLRSEGGVVVSAPALSLPSAGTSPPVRVQSCFLEGFEEETVSAWVIESADASAYSVSIDNAIVRSGKHSLRLKGGSSVNFDGLRAQLPTNSRPKHVSFWLRTSAKANVGYLTLGGSSTETSVLFFHLRADGSAGLISSTGAWHGGPYTTLAWLHVEIEIDWAYRRADLRLDGKLAANDVAFAASAAEQAEEIHLFSFDPGTVWWDDIAIRL